MNKDKKDVNPEFSVQYHLPDSDSVAGSEPTSFTSFHYEFINQVVPMQEADAATSVESTPTKDEAMAAYEKLDNTLCLNSSRDLKFGLDTDYHVDCNDIYEMIHCLEVIKQFIESK